MACNHEDFPCCGCTMDDIQQFDDSDICGGCGEPYPFCRCEEYDDEEQFEHYLSEDMDGDHQSALASAGFGTDEDYGDYGEYDDYNDLDY